MKITVEGEWAHGVARWKSKAKTLQGPIHVLARRSEDGTWQSLMPSQEGLYLRWVDDVPESLVPAGEKSQLRTQAAEADALRRPQATPAVPPAVTVTLPSIEGLRRPVEPVPGSAQPRAAATPSVPSEWSVYVDETWGYSISYPVDWEAQIIFTNNDDQPPYFRQRMGLAGPNNAESKVIVWQKQAGTRLMDWIHELEFR